MSAWRTLGGVLAAAGLLLAPAAGHAQATLSQARSPASCVSFDVGNPNWNQAARAVSSNNSVATSTVNDNQATDALVCTQYAFAIPASATVLGIIIRVERRVSATAGVAPTSQVLNRPVDRDDIPDLTLSRTELLGNAPDAAVEAGLFKVPRVIG